MTIPPELLFFGMCLASYLIGGAVVMRRVKRILRQRRDEIHGHGDAHGAEMLNKLINQIDKEA